MRDETLETTPWQIDADEFPTDGSLGEQARFLLNYAILAPSSHNSQPWAFAVEDDAVRIFVDESRWLEVADPAKRELYLSVGCALETLLVAAEHFGFDAAVEYLPGGADDLAATVSLDPTSKGSSRRSDLFDAVTDRHTNHGVFEDRPLDPAARTRLEARCDADDVDLVFVDDPETKSALAELQARADERQFDDPGYRKELGYWIGTGALGASWLAARIGQLAVTHLDLGDREGRKNSKLIQSAPVVAVLTVDSVDRAMQLRTGQAFQRIALQAAADGVAVHPMSQILELDAFADELVTLLELDATPQHLFRLGYADPEETHTPRRPLDAVRR